MALPLNATGAPKGGIFRTEKKIGIQTACTDLDGRQNFTSWRGLPSLLFLFCPMGTLFVGP
jgi:hypothetical protein